ncbi:hypothetical protein [Macrococcoides caseolyticum]|uniref:hypothetical protein n=1 Tax=Macrococcoides caseolyticum TaxID=69966 RepID=UPI001F381CB1|nr:hypothetical protein [Macrococcus caseolyticus]MCE4956614.1 hypothetical protein [Macrococcus caseolyticus]
MLTSVIDTAASAATTSTTTKAPYIIAKSTVDKVKAGTYATKIFICLNPKKL